MSTSWDAYGRQGIDLAHKVSSFGFSAAKTTTKWGFSVARTVASTAVGATTTVVDHALFGGGPVTRPLAGLVVASALTAAEQLALAPIHLSEYITSTSLLAAHSSINVLAVIFPGSSDASFSLASFIGLVRREWAHVDPGTMPEVKYGLTQVARAVIAWVALQGVTQEWQERQWFLHLTELDVMDPPKTARTIKRKSSRIRVTSDIIFPGQQGKSNGHQVIAADIGEPATRPYMTRTKSHISLHRHRAASFLEITPRSPGATFTNTPFTPTTPYSAAPYTPMTPYTPYTAVPFTPLSPIPPTPTPTSPGAGLSSASYASMASIPAPIQIAPVPLSNAELKITLRRLSKMVLAGYGGASLLFFGIAPSMFAGSGSATSSSTAAKTANNTGGAEEAEKTAEEAQLASAVDAAEAEAAGDGDVPAGLPSAPGSAGYSWWDVLLGKHDVEIFESSVGHKDDKEVNSKGKDKGKNKNREKMKNTAVIGNEHLMPRFWVLTDHARGEVVLVIRGTMSLNEIAIDLTCDPEPFEPARTAREDLEEQLQAQAQEMDLGSLVEESAMPQGMYAFPTAAPTTSTGVGGAGVSHHPGSMYPRSGSFSVPWSNVSHSHSYAPHVRAGFSDSPGTGFTGVSETSHKGGVSGEGEKQSGAGVGTKGAGGSSEGGAGTGERYYAHGGMARLAKAMGAAGKPVHRAVREALERHADFDLIICGHSLGAGVATILGLMWADPQTCQTVRSSGLPVGRQVQVYAFAPPTITDAALSRLCRPLVVSLVYSHDVVSRVALGSVRDLRNAAMWLCHAESEAEAAAASGTGGGIGIGGLGALGGGWLGGLAGKGGKSEPPRGEGWSAVTERAKRWREDPREEDMDWFIAVRKTLEANMQNACMYPPGRVLWAMRDGDLHPSHRLGAAGSASASASGSSTPRMQSSVGSGVGLFMGSGEKMWSGETAAEAAAKAKAKAEAEEKLRLFEVLDVERVFSQIVFARDMLSAHMPHQYDRVIHDLI